MIQLNESSLEEAPFGIKEDEIRKLLIDSIKILKGGYSKTIDFWDIKNVNRFQFLAFGLFFESFPRMTMLYYYVFDTGTNFKILNRLYHKAYMDVC